MERETKYFKTKVIVTTLALIGVVFLIFKVLTNNNPVVTTPEPTISPVTSPLTVPCDPLKDCKG